MLLLYRAQSQFDNCWSYISTLLWASQQYIPYFYFKSKPYTTIDKCKILNLPSQPEVYKFDCVVSSCIMDTFFSAMSIGCSCLTWHPGKSMKFEWSKHTQASRPEKHNFLQLVLEIVAQFEPKYWIFHACCSCVCMSSRTIASCVKQRETVVKSECFVHLMQKN